MYGIVSKIGNQSANGAEYESQGQARSASPLVCESMRRQGLKGRDTYYALSGLRQYSSGSTQGRRPDKSGLAPGCHISAPLALQSTLRALALQSYSAPLALQSHCVPLALQFTLRYISLTRGDK